MDTMIQTDEIIKPKIVEAAVQTEQPINTIQALIDQGDAKEVTVGYIQVLQGKL